MIYATEGERLEIFRRSSVYPVITADFCGGRTTLDILRRVLEGGARVVQIREKTMSDRDYFQLLRQCRAVTDEYRALLIADDRLDAAMLVGADGVHLGQDDLPCAAARMMAPHMLLGVSTHNEAEVLQAQRDDCSYLNIGPIFPTGTKSLPMNALGTETLAALIPAVHVPFSVMGGIKLGHLPALRALGCRHVAAVTAFSLAEDPAAEIAAWIQAMS